MDTILFRPTPPRKDHKLPFSLREQAVTKWLDNQALTHPYIVCKRIFYALQALNKQPMNSKLRFDLLEKLRSRVFFLADQLEKEFLDSSFPLKKEQNDKIDILVWTFSELAEGYQQISQDQADDIKSISLHRQLHSLSKAFLMISQLYEKPFLGFWQRCYQCYRIAKFSKLDKLPIRDGLANNHETSLEDIFKQLLLLSMSDTTQFRPREMKQIYEFLRQFASYAKFFDSAPDNIIKTVYGLTLEKDAEPRRLGRIQDDSLTDSLYVSGIPTAKKIYEYMQSCEAGHSSLDYINHAFLFRLVKTLGLFQKRKSSRLTVANECLGVMGFHQIIKYINQPQEVEANGSSSDIAAAKPGVNSGLNFKSKANEYGLVPLGEEAAHQIRETLKYQRTNDSRLGKIFDANDVTKQSNLDDIWQAGNNSKELYAQKLTAACEIIDESAQGYGILWKNKRVRAVVGDLVGIIPSKDKSFKLGVVRRISRPYEDGIILGIELISKRVRPGLIVKAPNMVQKEIPVLWTCDKKDANKDTIIVNYAGLRVGDMLTLELNDQKRHCRLQKVLHSTSSFNHFELFYLKDFK